MTINYLNNFMISVKDLDSIYLFSAALYGFIGALSINMLELTTVFDNIKTHYSNVRVILNYLIVIDASPL